MCDFEWDPKKAQVNRLKHGVAFADCVAVFDDPNALTIEQAHADEIRYITLGLDTLGRLLVVVYTWRDDNIRIVSARKASRAEVSQYERQL